MAGPAVAVDSSSGRSQNSRGSCFAPAPGSEGHLGASPLAVLTNSFCISSTTVERVSRSAWLHSLRASILRARSGPVGLRAYHAWSSWRATAPGRASLDIPSDERRVLSCGVPEIGHLWCAAAHAARSYSLIKQPRTGRRVMRSWLRSTTGWVGGGGRRSRARWGHRPL
jgi:hypothetical protein